jgi:HlyD family secretion protein
VGNARTQVELARAELRQAQADAARSQELARAGAISIQQAEQAQTEARTAEQSFRSAQAQIQTLQRAVATARKRVSAQQAVVDQEEERRSYTVLASPVTGSVLQRVTEPGNLAQAGTEILKLGDFSNVKIAVQVSELELGTIRVGQSVQVRLDSLPNQNFVGRVTRVSPDADPTARLIPVEVTIPNPGERIGSGLLARVNFSQSEAQRIVVPQTAIQMPEGQENSDTATLFTVNETDDRAQAIARSVKLGKRANGQVEILAGLKPGEAFVARSSKPLKEGELVRQSILSEKPQQERS